MNVSYRPWYMKVLDADDLVGWWTKGWVDGKVIAFFFLAARSAFFADDSAAFWFSGIGPDPRKGTYHSHHHPDFTYVLVGFACRAV